MISDHRLRAKGISQLTLRDLFLKLQSSGLNKFTIIGHNLILDVLTNQGPSSASMVLPSSDHITGKISIAAKLHNA